MYPNRNCTLEFALITTITRHIGNLSSQSKAGTSHNALTWSQIELLNRLQLGTGYRSTTFDLVSSSVLHPVVEGHTGHDTESQTGESDIDGTSFLVLRLLGRRETGNQLGSSLYGFSLQESGSQGQTLTDSVEHTE